MSSTRARRRRGVTRRIKDDKGNIIVKRYKRKSSGFFNIGIKPKHIPQIIIGGLILAYSGLVYLYSKGELANTGIDTIFEIIPAFLSLFLIGTIPAFVGLLLGYAVLTRGYRVKQWSASSRQIIAIFMVALLFTSIFSAFFNEKYPRHLDDDEYLNVSGDYDLSGLESPFYSEFLDGLLDLLGNIPDPNMIVANITASDAFDLNSETDRYLWRWQVAETYSADDNDMIMGYPDKQLDYTQSNYDNTLTRDEMRSFNVSQQMLSLTTSVTTTLLTPWNSEYASLVTSLDNYGYQPTPDNVGFTGITGYRDVNEQPGVNMFFDESGIGGGFNYNTYWRSEDKDSIMTKSIKLTDMPNALQQVPVERFDSFASYDDITTVWGESALPGGSPAVYMNDPAATGFVTSYDRIASSIVPETTAYELAFQIYNQVSTRLVTDILANNIDISATGAESQSGDTEKGYFYYDAVENGKSYGVKDMLVGFTQMLRAFNLPSRVVLGFSVGDVQADQIQLTLGHLHGWVEVLVPWIDASNNIHYSWGTFNPIPDPYIFAATGDLEYGKNALGGDANINIVLPSENANDMVGGSPIAGEDKYYLFDFDQETNGYVNVTFDDIPGSNQIVEFKLLNESILQPDGSVDLLSLDLANTGVSLGEKLLTNSSGLVDFTLNVTSQGIIYREYSNGTQWNVTADTGQVIKALQPLAPSGENNVYILLALYGASYDLAIVAWNVNAGLNLTTVLPALAIPDGSGLTDAAGVLREESFELTLTVTDPTSGDPVEGETNIDLLVMDQATFLTLQTDLIAGTVTPATLAPYIKDTFSATDINGVSTLTYNFLLNDTLDTIYAVIANYQGTGIYDNIFMYLTDEVVLTKVLFNTGADNIVNSITPDVFELTVHANELEGPTSTSYGFTARNAENISLIYYAMEKTVYEANVYNQDWAALQAEIGTCSTVPAANTCYFFDTNSPNNSFNVTGGALTNNLGNALATFSINNQAFSVGYYVILGVNTVNQVWMNTTDFIIVSGPGIPLSVDNVNNDIKLQNIVNDTPITNIIVEDNHNRILLYIISIILFALIINYRRLIR